jgi:hypothetical protein
MDTTVYYPPQMLQGIALGAEDPYTVAAAYGYAASEYDKIKSTEPFKQALARAQEQLTNEGLTIDVVAHAMLQEYTTQIASDLFRQYHHPMTPVDSKVKIASVLFTRENQLRDRVVKKTVADEVSGVQIVINIPDRIAQEIKTIEAEVLNG